MAPVALKEDLERYRFEAKPNIKSYNNVINPKLNNSFSGFDIIFSLFLRNYLLAILGDSFYSIDSLSKFIQGEFVNSFVVQVKVDSVSVLQQPKNFHKYIFQVVILSVTVYNKGADQPVRAILSSRILSAAKKFSVSISVSSQEIFINTFLK